MTEKVPYQSICRKCQCPFRGCSTCPDYKKTSAIMMPWHVLNLLSPLTCDPGRSFMPGRTKWGCTYRLCVFWNFSWGKKRLFENWTCSPSRQIMCASADFNGNRPTKEWSPLLEAQRSNPASVNVKTM